MRITNTTSLPEPLAAALRDDGYSRGRADISVTGLIAPPRKVALEERHAAILEEDAADQAAILIGKAVHWYIWWASARKSWEGLLSAARAVCSGKMSGLADGLAALRLAISALDAVFDNLSDNKRLYMRVNGWVVSGQTDHADTGEIVSARNGKISDWKTVSVNEWKYGLKEERAAQLNTYAELLRANGYTVSGLSAILIFKDWAATRQAYEKDYPPHSIMEVEVPLWPQEQAQQYILERVLLHQQARNYDVLCSDEERWLRTKYAVVKGENKRATRLFETQDEAEQYLAQCQLCKGTGLRANPAVYDNDDDPEFIPCVVCGGTGEAQSDPAFRVEVRGGEPVRCVHFCTVGRMGLCEQWNGER